MRLAPAVGGPRLTLAGRGLDARIHPLLVAALAACFAACHTPAPDVAFAWTLDPSPPVADRPATLTVRAFDGERRPVAGADLRIEAHMSHPGMAPVIEALTETEDGVYTTPLRFTMGGDWIVLVSGSLRDGRAVQHRIDVRGVVTNR